MQPLKIIFAGTPAFAALALKALIDSPHQILAVYTQPDRPSGRGLKLSASPVKELALAHHLPVLQPASLKDPAEQQQLAAFNADVMIVAAYGMLLPQAVLDIPPLGCINIHPSLLPRWRGAAPIQRTIFAGDKISGMTIMQMDKGLDTGDILLQRPYTLAEDETAQSLHDKMAVMGADCLLETLDLLVHKKLEPQVQDDSLATYANKITKEEALINWAEPAQILENKIRAFNPWPVAFTTWNEQHLRIWMAKVLAQTSTVAPGTIIAASEQGIDVATGQGVLRLLNLQLPGSKALPVADFYHARQQFFQVGTVLR